MSILSLQQLKQMVKNPHIDHWHEALDQLLDDYDINTPLRVAHFVPQCAHESGNFVFIKENLMSICKPLSRPMSDDVITVSG